MAKKQVYVAAVTKNGIVEAMFKEYFDKNPIKRKDWEKQMYREHRGCSIEELSGAKVEKEVERFGKWHEKEKTKNQKKIGQTNIQTAKSEKTDNQKVIPDVEEKPKKRGRKKK